MNCLICGSDNGVCNYKEYKKICRRHQNQVFKYGKILERTIKDKNTTTVKGSEAYISLYNKQCEKVAEAIIDKEDIIKVKDIKWCVSVKGYVSGKIKGKDAYLHQIILPKETSLVIDHIDRNPLNNRKNNLRQVTPSENCINKVIKGVHYVLREKKWVAYITKDYKRYHLGYFKTIEQALLARSNARNKYYRV